MKTFKSVQVVIIVSLLCFITVFSNSARSYAQDFILLPEKLSGFGNADIEVAVDPAGSTGDKYQIIFSEGNGSVFYHVENLTTQSVIIVNLALGTTSSKVEGLTFTVGQTEENINDIIEVQFGNTPVEPPVPVFRPGDGKGRGGSNSTNEYTFVGGGGSGEFDRINRFASRAVPYDYEIRFDGNIENRNKFVYFQSEGTLDIPFSLWNIGINTPDETSDDRQMIAVGFDDNFNFSAYDGGASPSDNGVGTMFDRIYFYEIDANSPQPQADFNNDGLVNYDDFLIDLEDNGGDISSMFRNRPYVVSEIISRFAMVALNGDENYLPPVGTTVRITTTKSLNGGEVYEFDAPQYGLYSENLAFDFGQTLVGEDRLIPLTLFNRTNQLITVSNINSTNNAFSAEPTNFTVQPGISTIIGLQFTPGMIGTYSGAIVILSDDAFFPEYKITVNGQGIGTAKIQSFTDVSNLLQPNFIPNDKIPSGASAIDINNDGLVDIYHPGRLYINNGESGFVDMLPQSGILERISVFGGAFGDYNNDGWIDIFLEDINEPSPIFKNNGNITFTQVNEETGISMPRLAQGAAWVDFNLDGKLDLFINSDAGENRLFKNIDNNIFNNVSVESGVEALGNSYGVAWADINNDLFPDFLIATCDPFNAEFSIKHLMLNNDGKTFTDINHAAALNDSLGSWGISWLDYDNDGDFDAYITNTDEATVARRGFNRLYRNEGNLQFKNVTNETFTAGKDIDISYSSATADFNNDGWIDIYVVNSEDDDDIYFNNGDHTFTPIKVKETDAPGIHGVTVADFNNDGWVDIFTVSRERSSLKYNDGGTNHWIEIKPRGVESNYYGVGARVEVYTEGMLQMREITAGSGFCSQSHNFTAHFGLGEHSKIDSLIIKWPSRKVDKLVDVDVDEIMEIQEGDYPTSVEHENAIPREFALLPNFPNPFNPETTIHYQLPVSEKVTLKVFNITGQVLRTLVDEKQIAGLKSVKWDGRDVTGKPVTSGIYFYEIKAGKFSEVRKMILLK